MRHFLLLFFACSALNLFAQEVIPTSEGPLNIFPVLHSSMVLQWQGQNILIDPYGGADLYKEHPPHLILITDIHGDHYNAETLQGLPLTNTSIIAPAAVKELMSDDMAQKVTVLENGKTTSNHGITVKAVPMYNLPENDESRHPKGRGNGYVVSIGGTNIYISGDTEDIPEMRALKDIDIAFVCMNLPYTMDVSQAADAVIEFQPKVVYPFHYRGSGGKFSDVEQFKSLVEASGKDIEVRLRNWYNN